MAHCYYQSTFENHTLQFLFQIVIMMKKFFLEKKIQILLTMVGALGGFLYWRFVGCNSGTCVIKSVWYWSTLWGAAVGYLVGDMISDFLQKRLKRKGGEGENEISKSN